MAFSDNVRRDEKVSVAASMLTGDKPRSFGALGRNSTSDSKTNSNSLSINYGNGTTDWGPNSIWGNGSLGNGLSSRAATRENSREGPRHVGQEEHTKAGLRSTGSLGTDDLWSKGWKSSRQPSQVEIGSDGQMSHQQRSTSNTALSSFANTAAGAATRPPAISLNTTSATGSGHRYANSNSIGGRGYEPAPTVYTKHDRQQDPGAKAIRDSATAGSWSSTSPTDTRRQFPSSSRTVSQPMSRSGSQHVDERPTFTRPNYGSTQRSAQNSSRTPSVSFPHNGFADPNMEQLPFQFGQMSINGGSRPQTSYRSSDASHSNSFSTGISPFSRSSMSGPRASFGAMDDGDDFEGETSQYPGFPNSLSPIATNFGQTYGGRYPPTPTSAEFRPGQSFMSGSLATRGFETPSGHQTSGEWQGMANGMGTMQLSRPSVGMQDQQQAFMTPQMQQLLAAQLRQGYGPMFNPYAMPGAFHLNGINPYLPNLPMMHMTLPAVEPTPVQDAAVGENIQSALLFEFKQNVKTKRYELRDIYDHIVEFSGDQHGSRFIQNKLETANSEEKSKVFDELAPNAMQLMTDVFGNYVIQKFFEHGDQMHKKILAAKMKGQVLALTNQMYGCRVVQKALDHVLVDQQAQLVRELEGHVLKCVKDQNGNHVIQKAIEKCPAHVIGFIINAFHGSVQQLSVNSYGCRVIQRCLEHCDRPAKAMIMGELMDGIQGMITDQYGNYVVQHVVERDDGEGRLTVLSIVMKSLELYSKHKFASNVVEKCLEHADDIWKHGVLCKLAGDEGRRGPDGEGVLVGMIKDNYGNYVIQKLLDTISPQEYFIFLEHLQPAVSQAKRTGCGKQIQSVERKMERFSRSSGRQNLSMPSHATHAGQHPFQNAAPFSAPMAPSAFNAHPPPPPNPFQGYGLPPFASAGGSAFPSTGTTPPPLTADQSRHQSSSTEGAVSWDGEGQVVEGAVRQGVGKGF